jgi:LacI family transcriptional regulator
MSTNKRSSTLSEIAKIAGVSVMTASRALNSQPGVSEEKRAEILRIAEDMGYVANRFAQRLSGGKSHVIGVIAQLHTLYTSDLVLGIGSALRSSKYEMLVYSLSDADSQPPEAVISLLRQFVDGIIVILPFQSEYLTSLTAADLPIVTIDEGARDSFPEIVADNYQGARLAVQHLADLGHRRIGFIAGDNRLASARDRERAFRDMQAQLGLDTDSELIVTGNFLQQGGFKAAKELLKLKVPPTAIFAANDVSAVGALSAIRDEGLDVPSDMSLVGFDDIAIAHQVYPPLTTVKQPSAQMARAAVNTIVAMIAGIEPASQVITLPTELVIRQSTTSPDEDNALPSVSLRTAASRRLPTR